MGVKANSDEKASLPLDMSSTGRSSVLFLRIVPTMVSPLSRSRCPSLYEVKKLSHVTLRPLRPLVRSSVTRIPWFFSGAPPAAGFPVYTCIFQA